jgi:ankyrin repeat protein
VAVPVASQPASTPVSAPAAPASTTPPDEFWHAAEGGDLAVVRGVIASNADVNAMDPKGRRALILAIDHGQVTVVRELLAHGANPKLSDAHGVTPQIAAHARGNFEILTAVERSLKH